MPENTFTQENLRSAYLRWVMEQLGSVPLAELGRTRPTEAAPAPLDLVSLYVPLLTRRPEAGQAGGQRTERAVRWLTLVEVLNAEKRLAVLGEPGAGKSAFIDFVALCMAGELLGHPQANLALFTQSSLAKGAQAAWEHGALLPVKVTLREFSARLLLLHQQTASGETLWNFIVSELPQTLLNFAPALRQEWTDQGGLLLLDGLDEVPAGSQDSLKAAVQGFSALYPKVRMLATCRTSAYQGAAWKLSGFAEATLMPFGPEQIRQFVEQWEALVSPVAGPEATSLLDAIAHNQRLAEMARRPLTLTLLAALHRWGGGLLPDEPEELYAAVTQRLFEQWAGRMPHAAAGVEPQQLGLSEWLQTDSYAVRNVVNRLAFEALGERQALNGRIELHQEKLSLEILKLSRNPQASAALLADYLRARRGLLRTPGNGFCAFPHRAFQDYLAACYFTDHDFPEALASRLHADPDNWREVAQLAGAKAARGMAVAAWQLAEALCPAAGAEADQAAGDAHGWGALIAAQVLLAAQHGSLTEVPERYRLTADNIRRWLIHMLGQGRFSPVDARWAGDVLSAFGDTRFRADAWHLPNDAALGFIEIPAGPFIMGSDKQRDSLAADSELPQHSTDLPRYFIAKYPVTVAQFRAFVEASHYEPRDKDCLQGLANHPVVRVTVHDVVKYCEWLTETLKNWEDTPPAVAKLVRDLGWRVVIPSEAEWEKAARGSQGHIYPWGDAPDPNAANYAETSAGQTTAVGCFPAGASPYGCFDMAGNVWEWTRSAHKPYPYDRRDSREDLRSISFLVMRGGAFDDDAANLRCACRSWYYLAGHFKDGGFRLALSTAKM